MKTFVNISRWIGMAIVTGFLLAVASCAAVPSESAAIHVTDWTRPADDATWTVTPAAPVTEAPTVDLGEISRGAYLDTVRPLSPLITDAEWLDFAGIACASLDQHGNDFIGAVEQTIGQRAALTTDMASAVTGAVMGSFYCEHYFTAGG